VRSNALAVVILLALLVLVIALTALCIGVPLAWSRRRLAGAGATGARGPSFKEDGPLLLFFAAIGFGFIVVEIAQLQRLIVFLGHPTYGVSVVLLVLLLSAGAGSWLAGRSGVLRSPARARWTLVALLGILAAIGAVTGPVTAALEPATTAVRIAGAAAMLLPMGLLMGTAFPIGMSRAAERNSALMPWLWGLNGATSVCGSVLAMIVALGTGIQATYWLGVGFYVVAVGAYRWAARPGRQGAGSL
jgi:hypothetical protein